MPKTIIHQYPDFTKSVTDKNKISIAEMFSHTIQGEGVSAGVPATFMRMKGCTLECVWCDTLSVWKSGNDYSYDEVFELMESNGVVDSLLEGHHLILTGGSPLKQQKALAGFVVEFILRYGFKPYIEVENECVLMPEPEFAEIVDQWNNSPKLANSGMKERARYKADVIAETAKLPNSWFKFVVESDEDWKEINSFYLSTGLISKRQIIIMPRGETQAELSLTRELAVEMAVKHGVRFSDRTHVTVWNKQTGV